jgi:hypothetical protein
MNDTPASGGAHALEVTDEMVERAREACEEAFRKDTLRPQSNWVEWQRAGIRAAIRAALEAAFQVAAPRSERPTAATAPDTLLHLASSRGGRCLLCGLVNPGYYMDNRAAYDMNTPKGFVRCCDTARQERTPAATAATPLDLPEGAIELGWNWEFDGDLVTKESVQIVERERAERILRSGTVDAPDRVARLYRIVAIPDGPPVRARVVLEPVGEEEGT